MTEVPPKEERRWWTLDEIRELEMNRSYLHPPLQALKDAEKEVKPKARRKKQ